MKADMIIFDEYADFDMKEFEKIYMGADWGFAQSYNCKF